MSIKGKIIDKVLGKTVGNVVDKAGGVASDIINKKANEDKARKELIEAESDSKIRAIEAESASKIRELEASKSNIEIDYEKARASIDYLMYAISQLELKKHYLKAGTVNKEIASLISSYKVPNDRDDFFDAAEIIVSVCQDDDESGAVNTAWAKKYKVFQEKAKIRFKNDKEICRLLKINATRNKMIIGFSVVGALVATALVLVLTLAVPAAINENKVPEPLPGQTILVEHNGSYFSGKHYDVAESYFTTLGFESVKTVGLGDLITGWLTKENTVDSISIGGVSDFKANTRYYGNEPVIISYHSFK